MFKNQNHRSLFILFIMVITLVLFFTYLFIPSSDQKSGGGENREDRLYPSGLFKGLWQRIGPGFDGVFKQQVVVLNVGFEKYGIGGNQKKVYENIKTDLYSIFDLSFVLLSKKSLQQEWIKGIVTTEGCGAMFLIDLEMRSADIVLDKIGYNDSSDVILLFFNSGGRHSDLLENYFKNIISFDKKDLIFMFKLIKLGNKIKEIQDV